MRPRAARPRARTRSSRWRSTCAANLTATGLRVSAIVSADSILQDKAAQSGQDMAVFPKLFDRVCVFATADNVSTLQSAIAADSSFDAATRFVPFLTQAPDSGSYVTTG